MHTIRTATYVYHWTKKVQIKPRTIKIGGRSYRPGIASWRRLMRVLGR